MKLKWVEKDMSVTGFSATCMGGLYALEALRHQGELNPDASKLDAWILAYAYVFATLFVWRCILDFLKWHRDRRDKKQQS